MNVDFFSMCLVIFVNVRIQASYSFLVINVFSLRYHFLQCNQMINLGVVPYSFLARCGRFLATGNVLLLIIYAMIVATK